MSHYHKFVKIKRRVPALLLACAVLAPAAGLAQIKPASDPAEATQPATANPLVEPPSKLDALMFYQLLISELELQGGRPGVALEVLLEVAKRTKDEDVYQRAVEVALEARAGEQALSAVRAWRSSLPNSLAAVRYQAQILGALGRPADAAEPVRAWLARAEASERLSILAGLPRIFARQDGSPVAAKMIDEVTSPYTAASQSPGLRQAAWVASGRAWLQAGDTEKAFARAQSAAQVGAQDPGSLLLALELMPRVPAAEDLVLKGLQRADTEPVLRLAYARTLMQQQRLGEAAVQLGLVNQQVPTLAEPWLTLGAVELELKHPQQAEAALNRYLELTSAAPRPDADEGERGDGRVQARLMLAQAAEMRKDYAAAEAQLAQITSPEHAFDVQTRRANALVRQGRWREAQELVRGLPAANAEQARRRLMAEVNVLREARQWALASALLAKASAELPADVDLLYEKAMMAEKLDKLGDMEQFLRRVIEIKPDHQHAYNALGYSLADRGIRLDEAKVLIQKALALAPGDPFITDSLAWVKYRQGLHQEAAQLLRQAYKARPDTEIAAHLGEVLWALGQRDEARRIWSEGKRRDAENEVLLETLKRLQPGL